MNCEYKLISINDNNKDKSMVEKTTCIETQFLLFAYTAKY